MAKESDRETLLDLFSTRGRGQSAAGLLEGPAQTPAAPGLQYQRPAPPKLIGRSYDRESEQVARESDESTEPRTIITLSTPAPSNLRKDRSSTTATVQRAPRRR